MSARSTRIDGPFELRAAIDELEKTPRKDRRAKLRCIAPFLHQRWSDRLRELGRERGLRAIAEDLFLLATVEFAESGKIALDAAADFSSLAGSPSPRATRLAAACRNALTAPVLLGAAQRALEETRCALLLRTHRDGLAPVTADGDPILARLGALLVATRASVLSMCEALHLLTDSLNTDSKFADDRAVAAGESAFHSARATLRATLLGSLELSSATNRVRETRLLDWTTDALHWSQMEPAGGPIESAVAREFLRFAR